jgi:alcohol dehydrogenase (NADP+)
VLSATRVDYNAALVGGIPKTHEIVGYCANNKIYSQIEEARQSKSTMPRKRC